MLSANWTKWLNASVNLHFDAGKAGTTLFFEPQELTILQSQNEWVELRINGPDFAEINKEVWDTQLEIDLMCCVKISNDKYAIHKLVGKFQALFTNILIYKYGNGNTLFGCLLRSEDVRTQPWGRVERGNARVTQVSLAARYHMQIEE